MKRYFVASDIHGFYSIFFNALKEKGFDINNPNHNVIICGDVFDRGKQAQMLLDFLTELNKQGRLLLVKGNHEWLLEDCLTEMEYMKGVSHHHITNGTYDTIAQLTDTSVYDLIGGFYDYDAIWLDLEKYHTLIWEAKNYIEIGDYIFVHGWIPHIRDYNNLKDVSEDEWQKASWLNGMEQWHSGWKLDGKTIVCGHWHTSYGNFNYHSKGSGYFEDGSCFEPFIDDGIIALDACTAFSKKVNIFVLDI